MRKAVSVFVFLFIVIDGTVFSQVCAKSKKPDPENEIPSHVASFVEKNTEVLAVESGDLNGDTIKDFILVLERKKTKKDQSGFPLDQRLLLVLIADQEGALQLVKRNEKIVMCSECGGAMGDPFAGIDTKQNSFSIHMYGGSAWRWDESLTFEYFPTESTWYLSKFEKSSFHASEPDAIQRESYVYPKHFGKIDINEFDPKTFYSEVIDSKTSTN